MTYAMIETWRMAFEGIQKAMADLKKWWAKYGCN